MLPTTPFPCHTWFFDASSNTPAIVLMEGWGGWRWMHSLYFSIKVRPLTSDIIQVLFFVTKALDIRIHHWSLTQQVSLLLLYLAFSLVMEILFWYQYQYHNNIIYLPSIYICLSGINLSVQVLWVSLWCSHESFGKCMALTNHVILGFHIDFLRNW